jgi:rRNA maturation protein Nop10
VATASSNSPVCQDQTLLLSSGFVNGGTYTWSGPNGFTSNLQSPNITNIRMSGAGIYTVIQTQPGCGASSATVSVSIGTSLNGITVSSNTPVCANNNLGLSATSRIGITYNWSGPSGFNGSGATTVRNGVTTSGGGVYSLTMSSAGCGSVMMTVGVVVSDTSGVSASNNTPTCGGSNVYLTGVGTRGSSYLWTGPNGFNSAIASPSIINSNSTHSGLYTLQVTDVACGAVLRTTNVQVGENLNSVAAMHNGPVCAGTAVHFTATPIPGASYSWSGPAGFISPISNPVLSNPDVTNAGRYSVTVITVGCPPITRYVDLVVTPALSVSSSVTSPICQGGVAYLNASFVSNVSYQWAGPNGFTSSMRNPALVNVIPSMTGNYTVSISRPGCNAVSSSTSLTVGTTLSGISVSQNGPVCAGGTLNLSVTSAPGLSYNWTGPLGFVSNSATPQITPVVQANTGTYVVVVSSPGCGNVTRSISALVNPLPVITAGNAGPVCAGNNLTLTVTRIVNATYLWQGPLGFSSVTQNPVLSGTHSGMTGVYSVAVQATGCGAVSTTTQVSVSQNPVSAIVSSNNPLCLGQTLQLSASHHTDYSYNWTGPSGFVSQVGNPSVSNVSALNAGLYQVVVGSPGCLSVTRGVRIQLNDSSQVSIGSTVSICEGNSIYVSGNGPVGSTYQWLAPDGYTSGTAALSRSSAMPSFSGIYTLRATVPGCGSTTRGVVVQVGANISNVAATRNTPVCINGTLQLDATHVSGVTYHWDGPNGFVSGQRNPAIAPMTSQQVGIYTLGVVSAGCASIMRTVSVEMTDSTAVSASSASVCVGAPAYFSATAPVGSVYQWQGPAGYAATTQNPSRSNVQLSHAGLYTMTANVPGCGAVVRTTSLGVFLCRDNELPEVKTDAGEAEVADAETSVSGGEPKHAAVNDIGSLVAWPNPNAGAEVHLKWEGLSDHDRNITVKVFDATGKVVVLKSVDRGLMMSSALEYTLSFDTQLAKGIYTIETVHDGVFRYAKLLIE